MGLCFGLLATPATAQEADLACLDNTNDGTIYETDSGLTVTENTQGTAVDQFYFPDADTVEFVFQSDTVQVQASGDAAARLDEGTGDRTCLGNVDASSNAVSVLPENENDVTVTGGSSIDLSFRDANYSESNDEADVAYDADTLTALTVSTSFYEGRRVRALNADDGSELDSAEVDGAGDVTLDGLPDDQAYEIDLKSVAPNLTVTIDRINDSVTEGDTIIVEYTIENTGDNEDTQDVDIQVDGETKETQQNVNLGFGETFQATFEYGTDSSDVPDVDIGITSANDTEIRTVDVNDQITRRGGGSTGGSSSSSSGSTDEVTTSGPIVREGAVTARAGRSLEDDDPGAEGVQVGFDGTETVESVSFESGAVSGDDRIEVVEGNDLPPSVSSPPGDLRAVVQIDVSPGVDGQPATVTFRLDRTVFEGSPDRLAVHRYDALEGEWIPLETRIVEVGDDAVRFEADVPGFSLFVVTEQRAAQTATATPEPTTTTTTAPPEPTATTTPTATPDESRTTTTTATDGQPGFGVVVVAIAMAGFLLAAGRLD